jgi:hypothetical protein
MSRGYLPIELVLAICLTGIGAMAFAESQATGVTLLSKDGKRKDIITKPDINLVIKIRSARGYFGGNAFQHFDGVYVTEPVVPPEGVKLKKQLIPWRQIQKIAWGERQKGEEGYARVKLTDTEGKEKDVFLWIIQNEPYFSSLEPNDILITGKMQIGDKMMDVEINGEFTTLIINRTAK